MENDLKVLNDEYLGNPWPKLTQMFKASFWDNIEILHCRYSLEDNLMISTVEYISNHWKMTSDIQSKISKQLLIIHTYLKIQNWMIFTAK